MNIVNFCTEKLCKAKIWNEMPVAVIPVAIKKVYTLCRFACFATHQYTFKRRLIFTLLVLMYCLMANETKAQSTWASTTQLIEKINVLMPYRLAVNTINYQLIPKGLNIKAINYKGLYSYAEYLKHSVNSGTFISFSESCLNHIASRRIKNPNGTTIFKERPGRSPTVFD